MSRYAKAPEIIEQKEELKSMNPEAEWSIKDTEFLLRLIMSSKIDGGDIEIAASAIKKVKALHYQILEHRVGLNA